MIRRNRKRRKSKTKKNCSPIKNWEIGGNKKKRLMGGLQTKMLIEEKGKGGKGKASPVQYMRKHKSDIVKENK